MLSVLIPVYNFDIRALVHDLQQKLTEAGIPFEIICFDDGSKENFKQINRNIALSSYYPITYFELEQNLGRARIRNALAAKAQYPYLLFMDCDSKVINSNYIEYYIEYLRHDTLLYGGRSYAPTPPQQPELYFHWIYGTHREVKSASERAKQPYHSFMTNNFLIPKSIFDSIKFDERLTKYGHEDTLFGLELQKHNIKILHLDNPLEHIGLEEVNIFLEKTQQGIQNLAELVKEHPDLDTTLIKTWKYLQKWYLTGFVYFILQLILPFIQWNLKSGNPSLKLFDLYKLSLLIQEMKKK
ncbi:MAG: glycosyltransferase family 2 protein [Saprospiraceae bacterium]|nr:glycosyltransferase family 2 protein [Saprospiraceae bacterium]